MAQAVVCQASFAGLAVGDLAFQERFQFGQRAIELVGNAHHRAGFLNARDRLVENIDLGHVLRTQFGDFVSHLSPKASNGTSVTAGC